jgi:hypothetical protein
MLTMNTIFFLLLTLKHFFAFKVEEKSKTTRADKVSDFILKDSQRN